jgi:hypothetical protein
MNIEQESSNDEVWNRLALTFYVNINDKIPYFDNHNSTFDIQTHQAKKPDTCLLLTPET